MALASASITLTVVNDGSTYDRQYALGTSGTTAPTSGWSASRPSPQAGKYIWMRERVANADGTYGSWETPVCLTGETGAKGDKGDTGNSGKGISSIVEYYAVSASNSTAPSSWGTSMPTLTATNKYLWNYTRYTYTDGTYVDTTKIVIGTYGDKGDTGSTGSTGVGVSSIAEKYAVSSSNSTEPTSWQDTVPTLTATNRYLWNYEIFTLTNGTTKNTKKRVIGVYGDKGATGATGATGNGISSIVNYYLASASGSGITNASSGFTTTIQTLTATLKYLWNYELITYTNGTTAKSPACVIGVYGDKGATGATGPKGDKGDTGPAGTPGFLGVNVSSGTIYVKGFDADGNFTASTGYVYFRATRYTVPAASYTPSIVGKGKILFDLSNNAVRFAKRVPNSNGETGWVEWRDFNTSGSSTTIYDDNTHIIIGAFERSEAGTVTASIVSPTSIQDSNAANMLQLLDEAGENGSVDLDVFAKAMGIERVFTRVAMLEAIISKLSASNIRVMPENIDGVIDRDKIDISSIFGTGITINGDGSIVGGDGKTGWKITGDGKATFNDAYISGVGEFRGQIVNSALTTNPAIDSFSKNVTLAKNMWSTKTLFNALTDVPFKNAFTTKSGSYNGETVTGVARQHGATDASTLLYETSGESGAVNAGGSRSLVDYTVPESFTQPILMKASGSLGGTMNNAYWCIKRNGIWYDLNKSTECYVKPGDLIRLYGHSWAWWGSQTMTNNYLRLYSQPERMILDSVTSNGVYYVSTASVVNLASFTAAQTKGCGQVEVSFGKCWIKYTAKIEILSDGQVVGTISDINGSSIRRKYSIKSGKTVLVRATIPSSYTEGSGDDETTYNPEVTTRVSCISLLSDFAGEGTIIKTGNVYSLPVTDSDTDYRTKAISGFWTPVMERISGQSVLDQFSDLNENEKYRTDPDRSNTITRDGVKSEPITDFTIDSSRLIWYMTNGDNDSIGSGDVLSSCSIDIGVVSQAESVETVDLIPKASNVYNIGKDTKNPEDPSQIVRYKKGFFKEFDISDSLTLGTARLQSNGYTQLPNGLILQWGTYYPNAVDTNSEMSVSFNTPFTELLGLSLTPFYFTTLRACVIALNTVSNSGFVARGSLVSSGAWYSPRTMNFTWIAIGQ